MQSLQVSILAIRETMTYTTEFLKQKLKEKHDVYGKS